MYRIVGQRHQPSANVLLKMSLVESRCTPVFLTIIVADGYARLDRQTNSSREFLLAPFLWAGKTGDINSRIDVVHVALESFRNEWTNKYLDAIESSEEMDKRLTSFRPCCDWGNLGYDVRQEDEERWQKVAMSPELRELAVAGRRLYNLIFGQHEVLKQWIDGLPAGSRLSLYWKKEDRGAIPNLPWTLLYCGKEPKVGEAVDALQFLGLRYRLEYSETLPHSFGLGRPEKAYRGHVFFWKGDKKRSCPDYAEAQAQYRLWSGLPKFYAVPNAWPPTDSDTDIRERARELLKVDEPYPMTLIYLYCQCAFTNHGPKLYFGDPNEPEVTIAESDLPELDKPYQCEPLVFVNACSTSAPAGIAKANLLESNFLERGCRAYIGTLNRVPTRVASRFAQAFFRFFLPGPTATAILSAGESVGQARLFLWTRYKNIGGLYYNYINNYDICMINEDELNEWHGGFA